MGKAVALVVVAAITVVSTAACGPSPRPRVAVAAPIAATPTPAVAPVPPAPPEPAVLDLVLAAIADEYVDPTLVVPRTMLTGAIDAIQRDIPEVMATPRDDGTLDLQIDQTHHTVRLDDVDSPAALRTRLTEVLREVHAGRRAGASFAELEYTAINGMLATLDPHSQLFDPAGARELQADLGGSFGGIGVVIDVVKDGASSVVVVRDVRPDGPAARAGVAVDDRVRAIDGEPTAALTIDDAIARLRGPAETVVTLAIERAGATGTTDYKLTRAEVTFSAVSSQLLAGGVGYIRIASFTKTVGDDATRAVAELAGKGARAWVLDLRGNVGGSFTQATRVADLFLSRGTMVVVEAPKEHQTKAATADAGDQPGSLVVLVDAATASAGEILAGALHDLDRAMLVGRRTFGKASVQQLHDPYPDGSQLKLTTAQYVAASEVSLQATGIVPDLELDPVRVPAQLATADDVLRLEPAREWHEADVRGHLTSTHAAAIKPPAVRLSYLAPAIPPARAPGFTSDFEIELAHDLALVATDADRATLMRKGAAVIGKRRTQETARIAAALGKLGIAWTPAPRKPRRAPALTATFTTDQPGDRVAAGGTIAITGAVTNTGNATAYQVWAHAAGAVAPFDDLELAFGKIPPHATRTATVRVAVPAGAAARLAELTWAFTGAPELPVVAAPVRVTIDGAARPQFSYRYQLVEDGDGADGVVRPGDRFHLRVAVDNAGATASTAAVVTLRSTIGPSVAVDTGRVELGALAPGESRTVDLAFRARPELTATEIGLELGVADEALDAGATDKLRVPVGGRASEVTAAITPPAIAITDPPLATADASWALAATATDDRWISDAYVLVANPAAGIESDKVDYVAGGAEAASVAIAATVPLAPGDNAITVVARDDAGITTERTIWVHRDAAAGDR